MFDGPWQKFSVFNWGLEAHDDPLILSRESITTTTRSVEHPSPTGWTLHNSRPDPPRSMDPCRRLHQKQPTSRNRLDQRHDLLNFVTTVRRRFACPAVHIEGALTPIATLGQLASASLAIHTPDPGGAWLQPRPVTDQAHGDETWIGAPEPIEGLMSVDFPATIGRPHCLVQHRSNRRRWIGRVFAADQDLFVLHLPTNPVDRPRARTPPVETGRRRPEAATSAAARVSSRCARCGRSPPAGAKRHGRGGSALSLIVKLFSSPALTVPN